MSIIEEQVKRNQYIEEVAAYIRVSTQEQKLHGISIEAQIEKLTEYAEKHGMKIVEWYKDEGVSGRKLIKKRPELQRMIQNAEKGKFKRIIFIKLDRFFRSVAEYHECMKRLAIGGVIWTATEEKYDLSTPSGEAFVNMKLTMAQFEADQAGERIRMVNEYKIKSGQPLFGAQCLPFGYTVSAPENGERHKYIAKEHEEIAMDLINHALTHGAIRGAMSYVNNKYGMSLSYNACINMLKNEMICGEYKGNPNYCEPYISREEFDRLQKLISRTPRDTGEKRTYIFSGLILCPICGRRLTGGTHSPNKGIRNVTYKTYRCNSKLRDKKCDYGNTVFEETLEKVLLDKIESIVDRKMIEVNAIEAESEKTSKYNVAELQAELDRLNYSWQKNRIKSAEEYDRKYDAIVEKIEAAQAEQQQMGHVDYERIQCLFQSGWRDLYNSLDDEHKRSFWRSFIEEIEIDWGKGRYGKRDIKDITFF